jgi:hypothetical protein
MAAEHAVHALGTQKAGAAGQEDVVPESRCTGWASGRIRGHGLLPPEPNVLPIIHDRALRFTGMVCIVDVFAPCHLECPCARVRPDLHDLAVSKDGNQSP